MARKKGYSADELRDIANKAKRANQRLREIERQHLENDSAAYRYLDEINFDKNLNVKWLTTRPSIDESSDVVKFRTDIKTLEKTDKRTLYDLNKQLDKFLEQASTSKIASIKQNVEKSKKATEKELGKSLSMNEFRSLWEDEAFKAVANQFGGSEALDIMGDLEDKYSALSRADIAGSIQRQMKWAESHKKEVSRQSIERGLKRYAAKRLKTVK